MCANLCSVYKNANKSIWYIPTVFFVHVVNQHSENIQKTTSVLMFLSSAGGKRFELAFSGARMFFFLSANIWWDRVTCKMKSFPRSGK